MAYYRELAKMTGRPIAEWEREIDDELDRRHRLEKRDDADDDAAKFENMARLEREGEHEDDDDDDDDDDAERSVDHHASKVADLLVEAKSFPDRAGALDHLLHDSRGQALLARMHKGANMTKAEVVADFKKKRVAKLAEMDIIEVAKMALARPGEDVLMISEGEFTKLITAAARKQYPNMRPDAAFAKLYSDPASVDLRKACAVIKALPMVSPFDVRTFSQDEAEVHPGLESNEAIEGLKRIGQQRWPNESEAKQFANAFEAEPELAAKAHRRPSGHPSFMGYPPASERERVR
jgi:hypothetical protein